MLSFNELAEACPGIIPDLQRRIYDHYAAIFKAGGKSSNEALNEAFRQIIGELRDAVKKLEDKNLELKKTLNQ